MQLRRINIVQKGISNAFSHIMRDMLVIAMVLLVYGNATRAYLFGSVLLYDGNPAYSALKSQIDKAQPGDICRDRDWGTTNCGKILVITSAAENMQAGREEYEIGDGEDQAPTKEFFQKLGMTTQHSLVHIENYLVMTDVATAYGKQLLGLVYGADVVYFNGGDQSRHARCWLRDDGSPNSILSVIRQRIITNQLIYIGVSAGTAVSSHTTFGGGSSFGLLYFANSVGIAAKEVPDGGKSGLDDLRNGTDCLQFDYNAGKMKGFQLIDDFQVDTHFDKRGRLGRLIPALVNLRVPVGVGVDEQATLYYQDGLGTVYGKNGVFISDISAALILQSPYFQIKNVKVHYLTPGDTFHFPTKTLKSSKSLITAPRFQGYVDSDDILHSYECTRLITRLVDQKGVYNNGKTVRPNIQFPEDTPTFAIMFYRNAATKGYFKDGSYTAESVVVDYSAY